MLVSRSLFLWRHFEIISILLFNKVSGSPQMMENFLDIGEKMYEIVFLEC